GMLRASGVFSGEDIKVGGTIEAKTLKCEDVKVGGTLTAERVEAESIKVGGTVRITGESNIEDLNVGGAAYLERGKIGDVKAGGMVECNGPLDFDSFEVGGRARLDSGNGGHVSVGGLLDVHGDLTLTEGFSVGGEANLGGKLKAESVAVGGRLGCEQVLAEDYIKVGRTLATKTGAKAEMVGVGKRGKVTGPIVGETVRIERDSDVEDVYAEDLRLEEGSTAANVYVEGAQIEDHCRVSGRLLYTGEVRLGRNVQLAHPAEKVSTLPSPPL
ncbi:MAG: hypothetical protein HY297_02955, partial [Thaumarchaeota archaeon]|nr:hypothetical protein [Nitrososphaerota archaeon]